jgi:hypothetical protein
VWRDASYVVSSRRVRCARVAMARVEGCAPWCGDDALGVGPEGARVRRALVS